MESIEVPDPFLYYSVYWEGYIRGFILDLEDGSELPDETIQATMKTERQLTATPTVCPNVPPYYVMLDGTLMQIKEEVEGDFSEYQVGIASYTGDLFQLPKTDGQSNNLDYEGCEYALKDGTWNMYFSGYSFDSWCRLGPDE